LLVLPDYISEELDIIKAFNENQESLLSDFIDNIDDHIKVHEVKKPLLTSSERIKYGSDKVEHLSGLSNDDYDIRDVFTNMMPVYQRQAMLLTLWGAFESELELLYCHKYKVEKSPRKPKGKNISYLKNILDSFTRKKPHFVHSCEYNSAVDRLDNEVRTIRNAWVHNGGTMTTNEFTDNINGIEIQSSRVVISKEYIICVINLMKIVSASLKLSFNNAANKKINKD